jgi:hypothetical protein
MTTPHSPSSLAAKAKPFISIVISPSQSGATELINSIGGFVVNLVFEKETYPYIKNNYYYQIQI